MEGKQGQIEHKTNMTRKKEEILSAHMETYTFDAVATELLEGVMD